MRIYKFFIYILIFLPFNIYAQVQVNLHQPPPNQLLIEQLWWVDLNNTSQATYTSYLHLEITEEHDGLVFRANTNNFQLSPGKTKIRTRDITDIKDTWYSSDYRSSIVRTGKLPAGDYTVCVYVKNLATGETLGEDCIHQSIQLIGAPRLISPDDGKIVRDEHLLFTWAAPSPPYSGRLEYELKIMEILGGQTKEEAMASNSPWFERSGITALSLNYPNAARPFEREKKYAWQVRSFDESGNPVGENEGRSEIYQFEYTPREHPVVHAIPLPSVSRTAERVDNYYKVTLTIRNGHNVRFKNVRIEDRSESFQCINKFSVGLRESGPFGPLRPCSVSTSFNGKSSTLICRRSTIAEKQTIRIRYYVVPVLHSTAHVPHIIGDSLVISFRVDDKDCSHHYRDLPGIIPQVPDPAFVNADFLIVTHPSKLFINNTPNRNDVYTLLSLCADLARKKRGVLGYLNYSYPTALKLRRLIMPGGGWYNELTANGTSTFDYLLLVGQTEIIPSFEIPWDHGKIPLSDYKYANITRDERPELAVGRILGLNAEELAIPIQSSIDVFDGRADYDDSHALLVGAAEVPGECFVRYIKELGEFLRSKIDDVFKIHGEMYISRISMLREGIWFDCKDSEYKFSKFLLREWLWKGRSVEGLNNIEDIDDLSTSSAIEKAMIVVDSVIGKEQNNKLDSLKLAVKNARIKEKNLNRTERDDLESSLATWLFKERNINIPSTGLVTEALEEAKLIQYEKRGSNRPVYKYYSKNRDAGTARNRYVKRMIQNRDIIAYRGHGGEGSWCWVLDDWSTSACPVEPIYFGNTRPVVLGFTCLSGYYTVYDRTNGYVSIARAFLRNKAAIYIGATKSTPGATNQELVKEFLDMWEPYTEVGNTFVSLKEYALTNGHRFQVYVYNLYGDPKFKARRR
jgi:hypothetical protein